MEKEVAYLKDRVAFRSKQMEGLVMRLESTKVQENGGHVGGGLYEA